MRIALVLAALAAAAAQDDGVRYEHKFTRGAARKFKIASTNKTSITMAGNETSETRTSTTVIREEVLDVDDKGGAKMKTTFVELKMKTKRGDEETEYDSTKKEDQEKVEGDPMLALFTAYVGKSVRMGVSKLGETSRHDVSEVTDALEGNPMGGMVEGMVRQQIEMTSLVFPDKAVRKGDTWKRTATFAMAAIGNVKVDVEYTFAGVEKSGDVECAKVAAKTTVSFEEDDGAMVKIKVTSQDTSSTYWFDPSKGELLRVSTKSKMKMAIETGGGDMEQEQESTFELERAKDY